MKQKAKKGQLEIKILDQIEKQTKFGDYVIEELIGPKRVPKSSVHWFVRVRCVKCNSRKIIRYHTLISNFYAPYTKCKNKDVKFFNNQELYFRDKNVGASRFPLYDRWYMMTHLSKNIDDVCPEWRVYKTHKKGSGGHYCINENFINYMNYENYIVNLLKKYKFTISDIKERRLKICRKVTKDGWYPGNICLHVIESNTDLS